MAATVNNIVTAHAPGRSSSQWLCDVTGVGNIRDAAFDRCQSDADDGVGRLIRASAERHTPTSGPAPPAA